MVFKYSCTEYGYTSWNYLDNIKQAKYFVNTKDNTKYIQLYFNYGDELEDRIIHIKGTSYLINDNGCIIDTFDK